VKCLSPADRGHLAKLLGLLGSDHAGERDAAALAAHRFVTGRGLTWTEAMASIAAPERQLPELGTWRETVRQCLARPGSLRPWEAAFLRDLPGFRRLSVKQRYVLKEIAERVLERPAQAGGDRAAA
jgi:hypothetical protein